ncbi:MAG: hypothetical protein MJ174_09945 [Treponema sp.]|nr:hypothetical protein [Treponema sp.]
MNKILQFFKKELMLTVALLAAIISLFITPPSLELVKSIDWKTLAILFMLLTVLEGFKKENIFSPLLKLTSRLKSMKGLSCFFVYSVFLTSMFVTNDVSLIIFVPLTIILFKAGNKEKYILPVLTFENIAAIRGSLLTPFGSPQNLYLFSQSGIPAYSFILMMLPLWIFSAILLYIFILFLYRKDLKEEISITEKNICSPWKPENKGKRILYLSLFILVIATIVTRTKFWPIVTVITAILFLIFDRKILIKTDYVLLLTFLCFFTFSSSICHKPEIADFLSKTVTNHEYLWSILLSQIISNVPASIVLWPFTTNLQALIYGLDSAGLCSIIGSLASVINLRIYNREYPGKTLKFIITFTWISLIFFAIVVLPQWILIKYF